MTTPKTVNEYLAAVPPKHRALLKKMRAIIKAMVPNSTEKISWGMPVVNYRRQLVGFAAFTNHCSLFVMSLAVMKRFARDIAPYQTSKGTIQFTVDKPLPVALIRKLVKARVEENEATVSPRKK